GVANGLEGLELLDRAALRALEPEVDGIAGIHVREAGIVDYGAVARAFAEDVTAAGGEIRCDARVESVRRDGVGHRIVTGAGEVQASFLVNCAGLQSDRVARAAGADPGVKIVPFRGEYYELSAE